MVMKRNVVLGLDADVDATIVGEHFVALRDRHRGNGLEIVRR